MAVISRSGACCCFGMLLWLVACSCFCPVYWKLPWFASRLLPITADDAVLVTGASTGIGRHAALSLAKEGFTVFCGVRKEVDGEALVQAAERLGVRAELVKPLLLDIAKEAQIENAVANISMWLEPGRRLKGLFNNAAIGGDAPKPGLSNSVEHQSMAKYREVMDVNFFGTVAVTSAFLPMLRQCEGRILISSSLAALGIPFMSTYSASKIAVEGWSDSLHREVMDQGMHVALLQLGFVTTPLLQKQASTLGPDVLKSYDDVNYPNERHWWDAYFTMSALSYSPRQSSEAVIHAFRAKSPARRYLAGFGSEFMRITPRLPTSFLDQCFYGQLLKRFLPVSEEDVREAIRGAGREFEL